MSVTNVFQNRSGVIPLADLDTNFSELDTRISTASASATAASAAAASASTAAASASSSVTTLSGTVTTLNTSVTSLGTRVTNIEAKTDKITGLSAWTIVESGGVLYFRYNGVSKFSLDSSGNLNVTSNLTAYASI